MIIFIFSLSVLAYIFLGYPMLLAALSVFLKKEIEKKEFFPSVSLIISAYNEENVIREKIINSLELDYPKDKLEIIIASESTDKTNEIAKSYGRDGIVLYAYEGREGKRSTLYRTVPKARGEIVIFSDANAMYEKDAIKKLTRNFYDKRIGCVSGRLKYRNTKGSAVGKGEETYWEFDFFLKMFASKMFLLGAFGGVNGSIFAIRKNLYNPISKDRGDDFEISTRIQINGYGVIMEPEAVSYEEASEKSKQEFDRKVRLAAWNFKSSLMLLSEALLKRKFLEALLLFSHRLLRYTTPIWIIAIFISNLFLLNNVFFRYFLGLQIVFYLFSLLGFFFEKRSKKITFFLVIPFYFCMVNYAALVALIKNIFVKKTQLIWDKSR